MLIKINQLLYHIILSILITIASCEYRSINGEGNNRDFPSDGIPITPLGRELPQSSQYVAEVPFQMVPTPGNYGETDPVVSCADPLPANNFPLPRCVSNKITAMGLQNENSFDLASLEKFKSKRKNSHLLTYWAFFIRMDIVSAPPKGQNFPKGVYIPTDDNTYLSSYLNGPQADSFSYTGIPSFQFNRSAVLGNGDHTGINSVTSFLDASTIYGSTEEQLQSLRDYNNNGKMKLIGFNSPDGEFGYPPTDESGEYIIGITASTRNAFTDMFVTIFLREHNRLCDQFFSIHGSTWDDERYFQEARKWVIAYIQKITYYEYLGTALGSPLPLYTAYRPEIRPIIDTFFGSVTFRYGHSEVSDFYHIYNEQGDLVTILSLHDLKRLNLLTDFGVPSLALSLALQLQEEVDIYFSEFMRKYFLKPFDPNPTAKVMDIAALDIVRSRDHGIPSYNDAREAFGLPRKMSFADISSDPEVHKITKYICFS